MNGGAEHTSRSASLVRLRRIFKGMTLNPAPLRESRDFRLLFGGQVINVIGSQITFVAVPYQVFLITHSSLAVGALSLLQFSALMTFSLLGGSLADVMDRRRLMLMTQALLACTSTLLAVGAFLGRPSLWYIFVVAGVAAGIVAIDNPPRRAAIPRLVSREQLANALTLNQVLNQLGSVAGPGIAGLILASTGFWAAYTIDAGTFLVSILVLLCIAPLPPEGNNAPKNPIVAIGQSLAFLKNKPPLVANFVADLNGQIFGLPRALFPALATDVYRNGAAGLGLLYAAPGTGALLGVFLTGWCGRVRRQGRGVIIFIALWGLAIAVFGSVTRFFWLGLLMLAVAGACDMFAAIFRNTVLQLSVPDRLRGRLSSVHFMVVGGGPRIGDAEAGTVATLVNPQFSIVSGGLLTLGGCVVLAFSVPSFWNWDAREAAIYAE